MTTNRGAILRLPKAEPSANGTKPTSIPRKVVGGCPLIWLGHPEHKSLAFGSQAEPMGGRDEQRDQRALSETRACCFRNRLLADLSAWPRVAFGLGLAWWRGRLLFADDLRYLRGLRHF